MSLSIIFLSACILLIADMVAFYRILKTSIYYYGWNFEEWEASKIRRITLSAPYSGLYFWFKEYKQAWLLWQHRIKGF